MTPQARYDRLLDELRRRFDNVVDHPVDQIGGYPQVVVYPQSPFLARGEDCDPELGVQVIVYMSRGNVAESVTHSLETYEAMIQAASAAEASWETMDIQPIDVGGVTHIAAVHTITVY